MELPRFRDDPRVGSEHARNVGVDLAELRSQGGGKGHCRRVRATPAQGGHVVRGRHALKAGHDHDVPLLDCLEDSAGPDIDDLGLAVGGVGDDPGLGSRVRSGRIAGRVDGQRQQRHGDALPRRE